MLIDSKIWQKLQSPVHQICPQIRVVEVWPTPTVAPSVKVQTLPSPSMLCQLQMSCRVDEKADSPPKNQNKTSTLMITSDLW